MALPSEVQEIYDWTMEVLKKDLASTLRVQETMRTIKPRRRLFRKLDLNTDGIQRIAQRRVDDVQGKMDLLNRMAMLYLTGDKELMEHGEGGIRVIAGIYSTEEGYKPSWRPE